MMSDKTEEVESKLTASQRDEVEWEKDRLVYLAGGGVEATLDGSLNRDERFLEWRARELRLRGTSSREHATDRVSGMRDRILSRVLAQRHGMTRLPIALEQVIAPGEAALQEAIVEAAAHHCAPRVELAVAAGAARELWDEPCTTWFKLPEDLPAGHYIAIDVKGASMEPLLHSGDVILVRLDPVPRRDTIVVARTEDEGYVVKSVRRVSRDAIELTSLNSAFADMRVPCDSRTVVGRVVSAWCMH